jgi:quercetin dioxygenase-like cupin family protein
MTTDEQLHQAASMAGLIDYQSGTVASRTIVKGKTGTVTVFAFDQGEELSEHTAPFDALVHVIDGQAEITIDGQPHALEAGEMIVMPADRPHAVRAVQKFKMVLVMIRS